MTRRYPSNERYQKVPFLPVDIESTHMELEVEGDVPSDLEGVYVRNGPNPIGFVPPIQHYFSGHGMVHGVRLEQGRAAWYRSRFVRAGDVSTRLGLPDISGPIAHDMDASPNTNIVRFGDTLYASMEAGPNLVELSTELDSVVRSDLGGNLSHGFTGHHKVDPTTGDIHAVVYNRNLPGLAQVLRLAPDGTLLHEMRVPITGPTQIHDMAITANYALILDLNVVFDPSVADRTTLPIVWNAHKPSRVGVVPHDGQPSDVRWFDVDPCYVYHPMNAFETPEGDVVIDVSRYHRASERDLYGPLGDSLPTLDRWTLPMSTGNHGKAHEQRLSDLPLDFPKVSPLVQGRPYRYGYAVKASLAPSFEGAVRLDLETGDVLHQDFSGGSSSELTFVPRPGATGEADGWVIGFVYQPDSHRSRLVILDGHNFGGDPVASIWLPGPHVPIGTHGDWFPDQPHE